MNPEISCFYLSDIKRFFFKNKFSFLLAFSIFFFIAFIILLSFEPKYIAEACFFEDVEQSGARTTIGRVKDIIISDSDISNSDASFFFKSKFLAEKLVKRLALQITIFPNENVFQRKCKIALKNLRFEFKKKVEDIQDIEYENISFKKTKPRFYYLKIFDNSFFEVLDLDKKVLTKSSIDQRVDLKDLSFTIKKIPKVFFNKTLKIRVDPINVAVQKILKDIKVIKDKTTQNYLILKVKNQNKHLAVKIVNNLMDLYLEHIKNEQTLLTQDQLKYLKERKDILEKDLQNYYEILEKYLKTNVKDKGFVNLDAEISLLLKKREDYQTKINNYVKELKYLKNFDLDEIEKVYYLDENFIKLIDDIKRLKDKKQKLLISIKKDDLYTIKDKAFDVEKILFDKSFIDEIICEVDKDKIFNKDNSFENLTSDFVDFKNIKQKDLDNNVLNILDLSDAKAQIKEISKKRENLFLEISKIEHMLQNIDKDSFQSNVIDYDHLTKNINEIAKKLEDSKNYTNKEIDALKQDYDLEKKMIKSYLKNSLDLKIMNLKTLDQQLIICKKIKLKLINDEILFLSSKAKDFIFEKIKKIKTEKQFLKNKLNDLKSDLQSVVEKLAIEKRLNLKSEMTKNMIDSLSKLIESKNLDFNLKKFNAKIISLASTADTKVFVHLFRNSIILAFFCFFVVFILSLYIKAIKGFSISEDIIKALNFDFFGKISFKCNGADVNQLQAKDLEALRKIISSIDEKKQKIITAICFKGPNYLHYLASLLAISKKNILVIETKSEIEEKNGLFPYLERSIKKLPIQKMQAYDYIASGNQKYFGFELLKSLDFIQMIDNIKTKYDLIFIYSNAKLNSAEARIYLDFSDKIIVSIKEESLDDLKPFLSWANEKIKLCFVTY